MVQIDPVSDLNRLLKVLMLRRTKSDLVAKNLFTVHGQPLREKIIKTISTELTPDEWNLYRHIHNQSFSNKEIPILLFLIRLRQICSHPHLIKMKYHSHLILTTQNK